MAILPGSLDYLYYNGVLDYIPYEAYEMSPMTPSGKLQMAGMGANFGPSYNEDGSVSNANSSQHLKTLDSGFFDNPYASQDSFNHGQEQKNNQKGLPKNAFGRFADKISNTPFWVKGLSTLGIMLVTLCCLIKNCGKPTTHTVKSSSIWNNIKTAVKSWFSKKP